MGWVLALVCVQTLAPAAIAAELSYAHFAPGAGAISVHLDADAPVSLSYREFGSLLRVADGSRQVTVRDAQGAVLAEGRIELAPRDRYVIMLAGNGSPEAPFQLRKSADHNYPFLEGQATVQIAGLAVSNGEFSGASSNSGLMLTRSCAGRTQSGGENKFGYGSSSLDSPFESSNLSRGGGFDDCDLRIAASGNTDAVAQSSLSTRPGERWRVFLIGDGKSQPYEVVTVLQQVEPVLPSLQAAAGFEGLWIEPGAARTGLQLAFNPGADGTAQMSALFFGYDDDGESRWNVFESGNLDGSLSILEFAGGNPEGTQDTLAINRGDATLVLHSCEEASLIPRGTVRKGSPLAQNAFPRDALRLRKLFPVGGCSNPDLD
jgi:hypothetical protein